MITIAPSRLRLLADGFACLTFGIVFFGGSVFVGLKTTSPTEYVFIGIFGLIGIGLLIAAMGAFSWLGTMTPALAANSWGIGIGTYFGKMRKLKWENVKSISVTKELESKHDSAVRVTADYIYVWKVGDTDVPFAKIVEGRLGLPFTDVLDQLQKHPQAHEKLHASVFAHREKEAWEKWGRDLVLLLVAVAFAAVFIYLLRVPRA